MISGIPSQSGVAFRHFWIGNIGLIEASAVVRKCGDELRDVNAVQVDGEQLLASCLLECSLLEHERDSTGELARYMK